MLSPAQEWGGSIMLKGISKHVSTDLLWVLASMGHGDDLIVVDTNFPAQSVANQTVSGKLVDMPGFNTQDAIRVILSLYPLDTFVDDAVKRMEVVGKPDEILDIHKEVQAVIDEAEGKHWPMKSLERFAFYEAAKKSYAVVRTGEGRPYGCFILKKGVIFS
jgi:L-fucose mutarotase